MIDRDTEAQQGACDVSILIPTKRNAALLIDTLASTISQATSVSYEILVLDNGCESTLQEKVGQIAQQSEVRVRYIVAPDPGLHCGRHAGARHAQSNILIFVDDDIDADPGWLQAIVAAFADPSVQLVGGRNLPCYETEPPAWVESFKWTPPSGGWVLGYLSLLDLSDQMMEIDANYIWGLNFAIRRQALFDLGGFNPDGFPWELRRYRGDGESAVTRKAKALGLKAVYQPTALVYHRIPKSRLTVEYFERRAYLQGISDSFTHIRANGGLALQPVSGGSLDWKAPLRRARNMANKALKLGSPSPTGLYQEVKDRVKAAYQAGYRYHQNEVRSDPVLLEWVLRTDYWDAAVPQTSSKGN